MMSEEKVEQQENEKISAEQTEETVQNTEEVSEKQSESELKDAEQSEESKKIAALEKQVQELTAANADLKEQVLRRAADFDNFRKRASIEKQEAYDFANTSLLKDLLDSLDNFDRTVEASATATDPKAIADGVKMINKSMVSMLETKYNLVSYGEAGEAFDPDLHEAIGSVQESVAEPVLKAVYLKGYKLKNRVIRHAKVMVSMPDGSVKAEESKSEENKSEEKSED